MGGWIQSQLKSSECYFSHRACVHDFMYMFVQNADALWSGAPTTDAVFVLVLQMIQHDR